MDSLKVLDKGFVRLDGVFADDLSVVNSARVSFNKRHEIMELGDDKLLEFLMKNRHGTPFEQNFFRFHVKAPIFVFREWHRHRIGVSINEWSARYSELKPDFYYPNLDDVRTQVGKPGHYRYEVLEKSKAWVFKRALQIASRSSFELYKWAIDLGVAKEQARLFLPVNIYSEMYWSANARSLMNLLSLRNHPKAQWEFQQYAKALEYFFEEAMPITAGAFIRNGRIAP
jgi:thymidylate synthase (FAD)